VVVIGNFRASSELRKKPRRSFHHNGWIQDSENGPLSKCNISDISDSGARIILESNEELPTRFLLAFTDNGVGQRLCQVIWRDGLTVGISFPYRTDPK
jgi:hypothetical protein